MPDVTDKTRRHRAILGVVARKAIGSQEQLAEELVGQGIAVTQATLSRDLKELEVTRIPTDKGYRYTPARRLGNGGVPQALRQRLLQAAALEVTAVVDNAVVVAVRTMAGRAQGVGHFVDSLEDRDIMATVAGDDTVIVYPRRTRHTARLRRRLAQLFGVA